MLAPTRLGWAGLTPYQAYLLCRRFTVVYHSRGYSEPVILLTDMVVENRDLALQVRNRYAKRWAGCETSVEFLKSQIGLQCFAVRKYKSMQSAYGGPVWLWLSRATCSSRQTLYNGLRVFLG